MSSLSLNKIYLGKYYFGTFLLKSDSEKMTIDYDNLMHLASSMVSQKILKVK